MTPRKRFKVKSESLEYTANQLPPLLPWAGTLDKEVDLLILPRGFEARACAFAEELSRQQKKIRGPILLGHYRTNPLDNDRRAEELLPFLRAIATRDHIECDAENPSDTRSCILSALNILPADSPCHVVLDISGASSTFILSTLLALASIDRQVDLTVLYASAAKYFEPKPEERGRPVIQWSEDRLREHGVSDVGTNELQPGIHHDHLPGYAIVIPSMFGSRLQRCLGYLNLSPQDIEEQEIYWLLPDTDSDLHQWRRDAVMQAVIDIMYCGEPEPPKTLPADTFGSCGALSYIDCARSILREVQAHAGTNISLIHMGTKLQSVGVALALAARPEVSLVHARPQGFSAENYSEGVGSMWQIEFGDLHSEIQRLSRVGSLTLSAIFE